MSNYLLISDAAKEVCVESHVLRYWEEELHLPIKRNELGHRFYTEQDVERFKQIKNMKERGLQLKAIKMILKDGKLDVLPQEEAANSTAEAESGHMKRSHEIGSKSVKGNHDVAEVEQSSHMAIDIVQPQSQQTTIVEDSREDKAKRMQWLLQQLIRETLRENNQELCRDIKESVLKELDYQFRMQEEREEQRDLRMEQRNEEYYRKMDELLRKKSRGNMSRFARKEAAWGKKKENSEKNNDESSELEKLYKQIGAQEKNNSESEDIDAFSKENREIGKNGRNHADIEKDSKEENGIERNIKEKEVKEKNDIEKNNIEKSSKEKALKEKKSTQKVTKKNKQTGQGAGEVKDNIMSIKTVEKKAKKKRHSIF